MAGNLIHIFGDQGFNAQHYHIEHSRTLPIDEFRDAMINADLIVEYVIQNEKINRVPTRQDKSGKKSGWYIFYNGDICAGAFGDWKSGKTITWSQNTDNFAPQQIHEHQQRLEQIKLIKEQETKDKHEKTAQKASEIWKSSYNVDGSEYLNNKQVKPYGIKQLSDGRLVLPIHNNNGDIKSIQLISNNGHKKFLTGGKIQGNFLRIGKKTHTIYICEGYATGATIHEATGDQVIIAFNSGNLTSVIKTIKNDYTENRIIIAADNDQFTQVDGKIVNVGINKAKEAASIIQAKVVIPEFSDLSRKPTDFNDLAILQGIEEVRNQLGFVPQISIPISSLANHISKDVEWVLDGVLSRGAPSILFATGGSGKSLFIQHLSSCIATGKDFYHLKTMKGPVLSIYCEDDLDEMHRRQLSICKNHNINYEDLNDLHVVNRVGKSNNFLITFDSKNIGTPTEFYHQIDIEMERIKPIFMTFDTSGDAFPGNENDKAQVNQLLKGCIGGLADKHNCTILLTGHTPKSGAEFAGHMAWENSVRHRIFIDHDRDSGIRKVKLSKSNRAKEGDLLTLYWEDGCLQEMVDTSFVNKAKKDVLTKQTLQLINEFYNRKTNINLSKQGNYAAKELVQLGQLKKIYWTIENYEDAIEELLENNQIELVLGHNRGKSQTLKLTKSELNNVILNEKIKQNKVGK